MLKPIQQLSWADRFGILNNLTVEVTPADICRVFNVTEEEWKVAHDLFTQGVLKANPRINHEFYELFFKGESPEFPTGTQRVRTLPVPSDNAEERRLYATNRKVVRPRGRKSNNIELAFKAVPTSPVDVEAFAKKHHVSVAVLRQHKRFDKCEGQVYVRKNKQTGIAEIWRDLNPPPKKESKTNDVPD